MHFLYGVRVSIRSVATCVRCLLVGLAVAATPSMTGCEQNVAASNLIIDSTFANASDFWTFAGRVVVVHGVGPSESEVIYFPGDGGPSGYRNQASIVADVTPGTTYSFSAYVDSTGHTGTPPYVLLQAENGSWPGASVYQPGKGRVTTSFSIPRASLTTRILVTFNPSNGVYPIGRGAIYAQPQLESGPVAHAYAPGPSPPPAPRANFIADSDLRLGEEFWNLTGRVQVLPHAGPHRATLLRIPGTGAPMGYDDTATFLASVVPGDTYTFSCILDGSKATGTPPYVFLQAVNGSWKGLSLWSATSGRSSTTFTVPADSGTTVVRGIFAGENGTYPIGDGAELSQPQIEPGTLARAYIPSSVPAALRTPRGANLVIDSEGRSKHSWLLIGTVARERKAGPLGDSAVIYTGNGQPASYWNYAAFFARVRPGDTYTLSVYIDGTAHNGTPPYLFATASNGTWRGAGTYQSGKGRISLTFTVPPHSRTTLLRCVVNAENGTYAPGAQLVIAEPQLERGTVMTAYRPSAPSPWKAPI